MSRITLNVVYALILGQLVSLLSWIDLLFIPLILAGPLLSGAILARLGVTYTWLAALWASTGLGMTWMDWVINREDVAFHLALALTMPLMAGIGWGAIRLTQRNDNSPATQSQDA